jgi:hypothetical protein
MARKNNPEIPQAPPPAPSRDERLAEIEEMIAKLRKLHDRERDSILRGSYHAAINRLEALAYRMKVKPQAHVIGLPIKGKAPPPAPEPPQRTLPLGPVPAIVKARPPKKRW